MKNVAQIAFCTFLFCVRKIYELICQNKKMQCLTGEGYLDYLSLASAAFPGILGNWLGELSFRRKLSDGDTQRSYFKALCVIS